MRARTLLSFLNLAALSATFVVWFAFPRYAEYAVYLALAWTVVAVSLLFTSWVTAPVVVPGGGAARAGGARGSAPEAGAGAPLPIASGPLPFCIYCGGDLPLAASLCPGCGHVVRSI
jgi:hypothetical protein